MKHIDIFSSISEYETAKSGGTLITPNVSFINESGGVICLPELDDPYNGHEYVDLGLPSGTKWATMNVGASSETDYGNYYKYGKGAAQYTATNDNGIYSGIEDPLDSSVDTAVQVWGGSWHMPRKEQMEELIANTTYEWVENYKNSRINGCTFTANGAVLFFPAAGYVGGSSLGSRGSGVYVWSRSRGSSAGGWELDSGSGYLGVGGSYRCLGFSVRGVRV